MHSTNISFKNLRMATHLPELLVEHFWLAPKTPLKLKCNMNKQSIRN
jgi:hypothetical protein